MVAVARGCALPGSQLQEESETVSALASLTVDVEQPFSQEDGRCSFFFSSFIISDIRNGTQEGEAVWDAGQGPGIVYIHGSPCVYNTVLRKDRPWELVLWNIPKYTAIMCQFSVTKDLNGKGMMGGSAESGKQIPEHAHKHDCSDFLDSGSPSLWLLAMDITRVMPFSGVPLCCTSLSKQANVQKRISLKFSLGVNQASAGKLTQI
ncbi:hypothetical protein ACRRTK_017237 [Alexandromys fortis]